MACGPSVFEHVRAPPLVQQVFLAVPLRETCLPSSFWRHEAEEGGDKLFSVFVIHVFSFEGWQEISENLFGDLEKQE